VAAETKTAKNLRRAEIFLTSAETPEPHFEKRRLKYLVDTKDAIIAINQSNSVPELKGIYSKLDNLSRYTILQPNFFGVGVNLNNIIDGVVERSRKSESE